MEEMYEVGLLPHKDWLEELVIAQSDDVAKPSQCLEAWKLGKLNYFTSLRRLAIPQAALEIQGQRPDSSLQRLLRASPEELQVEFPKSSLGRGKFPKGKPMTLRMLAEDGTWYISQLPMVRTLMEHKEEYLPLLKRMIWWHQDSAD